MEDGDEVDVFTDLIGGGRRTDYWMLLLDALELLPSCRTRA
jgi:hypothetical protein